MLNIGKKTHNELCEIFPELPESYNLDTIGRISVNNKELKYKFSKKIELRKDKEKKNPQVINSNYPIQGLVVFKLRHNSYGDLQSGTVPNCTLM